MHSETYYTKAIILSRNAFRERDSKILAYSFDYGLLELVARGTKKNTSKLAAHIEPITLSDIMVVKGRNYDYVGTSNSFDCFRGIKEDYEKAVLAGEAMRELKGIIKRNEVDESIYFLVSDFLNILNSSSAANEQYDFLMSAFYLKLFRILGYAPVLSGCVACRENDSKKLNNFDVSLGGVICDKCLVDSERQNLIRINDEIIKTLIDIKNKNLPSCFLIKISKVNSKIIKSLISSFKSFHIK